VIAEDCLRVKVASGDACKHRDEIARYRVLCAERTGVLHKGQFPLLGSTSFCVSHQKHEGSQSCHQIVNIVCSLGSLIKHHVAVWHLWEGRRENAGQRKQSI